MALQHRIIASGNIFTAFAMLVRFLVGPAFIAAASFSIVLKGVLLHIAIVQVWIRKYTIHYFIQVLLFLIWVFFGLVDFDRHFLL